MLSDDARGLVRGRQGELRVVWTSCRSAPVSPASCEAEIGPLLTPDHRGLASEDGGSPRHGGPALEEGGPVRGFKRLPARGLAVTVVSLKMGQILNEILECSGAACTDLSADQGACAFYHALGARVLRLLLSRCRTIALGAAQYSMGAARS